MIDEFESASETPPVVERQKYSLLSSMTPYEKMQKFFDLNKCSREFVRAGIKHRYLNSSEEELKKRLAAILLGAEFARKFYSWDPEVEGY